MRRVCLVSSGTGGHLLPALALSAGLRARGHEPLLVTEGRAVESSLLPGAGMPARTLRVGGGPALPLRVLGASLAARRWLRQSGVEVVICTGGRTSLPVGLAARLLGLPLCLLEQNAVLGRSNRWLAALARRIYLGLPGDHQPPRALVTGTPLRAEIGTIDRAMARERLGLRADGLTVMVAGGSQGARALNEVVPAALLRLGAPLQVLHLSGPGADDDVRRRYAAGADARVECRVRPLTREIACWYAAADLVICRGGGATVAELMAAARPAIVVPYPHHRDRQQFHNAQVLVRAGAAVVLEQEQLTVERLGDEIAALLPGDQLATMGARAAALSPADPCAAILDDLERTAILN